MTRTDLLNAIAAARGYSRYLEIGIRNPEDNFARILCADKTGVDPATPAAQGQGWRIEQTTSDAFFARRAPPSDIVFIDGDHRELQVARDLRNALANLIPGGTIVMHDCLPQSESAVLPEKPDNGLAWNGTAYLVWLQACRDRELVTVCVECDHGLGVIQPGISRDHRAAPRVFRFAQYLAHQREWSHVVSPSEFVTSLRR